MASGEGAAGFFRAAKVNEPHSPVTLAAYGEPGQGVSLVQIQEEQPQGGAVVKAINLTPEAMDALARWWLSTK